MESSREGSSKGVYCVCVCVKCGAMKIGCLAVSMANGVVMESCGWGGWGGDGRMMSKVNKCPIDQATFKKWNSVECSSIPHIDTVDHRLLARSWSAQYNPKQIVSVGYPRGHDLGCLAIGHLSFKPSMFNWSSNVLLKATKYVPKS